MTVVGDDGRVNTKSADRTGVLILRLWVEGNPSDGFRARITQSLDASETERAVAMAGSSDDVCNVVREWINAFVTRTDALPSEPLGPDEELRSRR